MTKKDVIGILALLQTEYPASFVRLDDQQMQAKANLWSEIFADDPAQLVYAAVKSIVSGETREFAPSAGDIKNKMYDLTNPSGISETEAWAEVSKAIRNGIYGYETEFSKLSPSVRAAVGRAEQLKEWALMPESEVQTVVASNFMRGFKTVEKRERETAMIPESVKTLLESYSHKMMLGTGKEDQNGDIA